MLHRQFAKVRPFEDELLENLIRAVKTNDSDKVQQLLEGCSHEERLQYVKFTLKTQAGLEVNLLHFAVINAQHDTVKILVSACLDADLLTIPTIDPNNNKDEKRWTPLQLAVKKKHWDIVTYLQHHTDKLASDPTIYEYARKLDAYILSAKAQKFDELAKSLRQHKMDILSPDHKISEVLAGWLEQFPSPTPQISYFAEKKSLWASVSAIFKPGIADSSDDKYEAIMVEIDKTVCQFQSKQTSLLSMLSISNRAG
jgi:hypothetical protein